MSDYTIDLNANQKQIVGRLNLTLVKRVLGITFPTAEVYMYPGVIKHLKKSNHWDTFQQYHHLIPDIIANPDYIGQNPKESDSIELYKVVEEHLLVAIKLDPSGYLFLSSFYDLNNGPYKIQSRLNIGRIKKVQLSID